MGKKSSASWYDRWEEFPKAVRHTLSGPGGSVTRTMHHLVFRSALRPSCQLRLCYSYVHPRRWQGPFGPSWCIPVIPMEAPGCCSGSIVRCSCLCLTACRVPYRAVSRGLCRRRVGAAVRCLVVRVARLVLWRQGVSSGAAGWIPRNTPVLDGTSRRARVYPVAIRRSLACPW